MQLRLPQELDRKIRRLAQDGMRPINSQVILLLQEALKLRKGKTDENENT